jgi:hypothetical protein
VLGQDLEQPGQVQLEWMLGVLAQNTFSLIWTALDAGYSSVPSAGRLTTRRRSQRRSQAQGQA